MAYDLVAHKRHLENFVEEVREENEVFSAITPSVVKLPNISLFRINQGAMNVTKECWILTTTKNDKIECICYGHLQHSSNYLAKHNTHSTA